MFKPHRNPKHEAALEAYSIAETDAPYAFIGKALDWLLSGPSDDGGARDAAATQAAGYRDAAKIYADESEKARTVQREIWDEMRQMNETWHKAGIAAVRKMRSGIDSGRFTAQDKLVLDSLEKVKIPSFEETFKDGTPKVRTAFDYATEYAKNWQDDPGYQYSRREGQRAINQFMAARGLNWSGAAGRALTEHAVGLADQQFDKVVNRGVMFGQLLESGDTAAYNRALGEHAMRYDEGVGAFDRGIRSTAFDNQNRLTEWNAAQTMRDREVQNLGILAGYGGAGTARTQQAGLNYSGLSTSTILGNAQAQALGVTGAANAQAQGILGARQWQRDLTKDVIGAAAKAGAAYAGTL